MIWNKHIAKFLQMKFVKHFDEHTYPHTRTHTHTANIARINLFICPKTTFEFVKIIIKESETIIKIWIDIIIIKMDKKKFVAELQKNQNLVGMFRRDKRQIFRQRQHLALRWIGMK